MKFFKREGDRDHGGTTETQGHLTTSLPVVVVKPTHLYLCYPSIPRVLSSGLRSRRPVLLVSRGFFPIVPDIVNKPVPTGSSHYPLHMKMSCDPLPPLYLRRQCTDTRFEYFISPYEFPGYSVVPEFLLKRIFTILLGFYGLSPLRRCSICSIRSGLLCF